MDTELQDRARDAWAMMVRDSDPMPAWAALDYVQEVCDDREACARALYGSVKDHLTDWHNKHINDSIIDTSTGRASTLLWSRNIDGAEAEAVWVITDKMIRNYKVHGGSDYLDWSTGFVKVLDLCRAIERAVAMTPTE